MINIQHHVNQHFKVKKGALHSELHVKQGQHIPVSELEHEKAVAKKTHNATLEKRVVFALNFAHGK